MKKYKILTLVFLLLGTIVYGQDKKATIEVKDIVVAKDKEVVKVSMFYDFSRFKISSSDYVYLQPQVISEKDSTIIKNLPPIVVMGSNRYKVYLRKKQLSNDVQFENQPMEVISFDDLAAKKYYYKYNFPFESWMYKATFSILKNTSGCAGCLLDSQNVYVNKDAFQKEPYTPKFAITYITPEKVKNKEIKESHSLNIKFESGKSIIKRKIGNNASEIEKLNKILEEMEKNQRDLGLVIKDATFFGFASPEGSFSYNLKLSDKRVKALKNYVVYHNKLSFDSKILKWQGKGEDWNTLRKMVAESNLSDKDQILDIIDNEFTPDKRDIKLKRLSSGETYKTLLNDFYPNLRRADFVISYIIPNYTLEEIKQIVKTNPKLLSLDELFMLSSQYEKGSPEFTEVFEIAAKMYPLDETAQLNVLAMELERGNIKGAEGCLSKIKDQSKAYNNLGVFYAMKKDYAKALESFEQANDVNAQKNIEELKKAIEEK